MRLESMDLRLRIIEAIIADPRAKVSVIAERAGCKPERVAEVRRDIAYRLEQKADKLLEEYQRMLLEQIPLELRVDTLRKIVGKHDSHPAVALQAVQAVDKLGGLAAPERVEHTGKDGQAMTFVIEGLTEAPWKPKS